MIKTRPSSLWSHYEYTVMAAYLIVTIDSSVGLDGLSVYMAVKSTERLYLSLKLNYSLATMSKKMDSFKSKVKVYPKLFVLKNWKV